MRAKDHNRMVKELNAKHAAKLAETENYYKQELADLQAQYEALCEASNKQDARIERLLGVVNIVKNDRRVAAQRAKRRRVARQCAERYRCR